MRLVLVTFLSLALGGCITASNTLAPDQVDTFKLAKVDVVVPDDARVRWGEGEAAYAASRGVATHEADSVVNTPEGRAHLRGAVAAKLKGALERELAGRLAGPRPVRLEVTVHDVEISPAIQRILIGGGHSLRADAAVVDAKTGAVLTQFAGQSVFSGAGNGLLGTVVDAAVLDAPIDRVVANFAADYRRWLLRG